MNLAWISLFSACTPDFADCMAGYERTEEGYCEAAGGGDTGSEIVWTTLAESCEAPAELGIDPIERLDDLTPGTSQDLVEMVDIEIFEGLGYAAGQGGLVMFDPVPGATALLGDHEGSRYHRVEPLGGGYVAVTHRDEGLTIYDVRDPTQKLAEASLSGDGWEGMSHVDGRLYVTQRDLGVVVIDVTDPSSPEWVAEAAGLEAPWELSKAHDGWIYAADNTLGVVPIDISDPDAPVVGEPVDVGGAVLHVTVGDGVLYASAGGAGIVVLDLADPGSPIPVATVSAGGSAVMTAVADGLLYAAAHLSLTVFDLSDPALPVPLGHELVPQFALGVAAADDVAWVADWTALDSWAVDREADSPEADVSSTTLRIGSASGTGELSLVNRGGADLHLLGATTSDTRLRVEVSATTLAPGEAGTVRLLFADSTGEPLEASLCLATDDADGPVLSIPVEAGDTDPVLGQPAPDFALPGLDGQTYRLSEQLGHPVMLVYFATW